MIHTGATQTGEVRIHGVSKRYGETVALQPMDLVIEPGRTTVLIGPSGCGKSTLLRLIIGLIDPTTGTLEFEGTPLEHANIQQLRHRMGYVIQDGGLFPHLTARGNVELPARYLKIDRRLIDKRLAELAEMTGLHTSALDRYPIQLSGGQRQRVSLMRALMLDPDLLLLDEPLGSLDPMIRSELQRDLEKVFRAVGKTVILVTHDLAEARFFGHLIVLLHEGRIVQRGSFGDLQHRPADPFVTAFLNAQQRETGTDHGAGG